jgi:hypothetical protein
MTGRMKLRSGLAYLLLSSFAFVAISCSQPNGTGGGIVCTALYAYGLTVTVQDSITGSPAAAGATVMARDGAYLDSAVIVASAPQNSSVGLAGERAGTYAVTVSKAGYQAWTKTGIQVTKEVCHVHGVAVTAKLGSG